MDYLAQEELQIEWNSRYDYIAELRAEHEDFETDYEYEDQIPYLRAPAYWEFCPGCDGGAVCPF